MTTETIKFCLDEDCPRCGYPEIWTEAEPRRLDAGAIRHGCNPCGWRSDDRQ